MIGIYVMLSVPFGWALISRLQRNITVITTISNYIVFKIILSTFVGWAVTPFYLLYFIFKIIRWTRADKSNKP